MEPETRLLLSSSSSHARARADFPIIFHRKFGIALQKLFAVRMNPSSRIGERDKDAIVALAQEIENCFQESSLHQPWDPTISDTVALVSAAKRTWSGASSHTSFSIPFILLFFFCDRWAVQHPSYISDPAPSIADFRGTR
jgi:hypothetical protein